MSNRTTEQETTGDKLRRLDESISQVEEFNRAVTSEHPVEKKIKQLIDIVRKNEAAFSMEEDDFADELECVLECNGDDPEEMENEGNHVISQIYDYADRNLVWLGV